MQAASSVGSPLPPGGPTDGGTIDADLEEARVPDAAPRAKESVLKVAKDGSEALQVHGGCELGGGEGSSPKASHEAPAADAVAARVPLTPEVFLRARAVEGDVAVAAGGLDAVEKQDEPPSRSDQHEEEDVQPQRKRAWKSTFYRMWDGNYRGNLPRPPTPPIPPSVPARRDSRSGSPDEKWGQWGSWSSS